MQPFYAVIYPIGGGSWRRNCGPVDPGSVVPAAAGAGLVTRGPTIQAFILQALRTWCLLWSSGDNHPTLLAASHAWWT
jgi:hypothetical protein